MPSYGILAFGTNTPAPTRLPLNSKVVVISNSVDAAVFDKQPRHWAYLLAGSRLYQYGSGNLSHAGDNYNDFLSRWSNAAAMSPAIVIWGNQINDVNGSFSSSAIITNINTALANTRSIGAVAVFDNTPYVVNFSPADDPSGNKNTVRLAVNSYLTSIAASDCYIADVSSVYDYTTMSYDGLHPTEYGANLWGNARAAAITQIISTSTIIGSGSQPSGNINTAWDMAGTSGTAGSGTSGSVATGWSVTNTSGCTCVASKGTQNGRTSQILTLSGSASSAGIVNFTRSITSAFTEGQFFEQYAELSITAADGVSAPVGLMAFGITANQSSFLSSAIDTNSGAFSSGPLVGVVRTISRMLTAPAASMATLLGFSVAVGTVDIKIQVSWTPTLQTESVAYATPTYQGLVNINTEAAVTGTPSVGSTQTCNPGVWSGGALVFTYQWLQNNVSIGGATNRTYVAQAGDSGTKLSCTVTGTNSMGNASQTTPQTATIT